MTKIGGNFSLNSTLEADTFPVMDLRLSTVRLMNDNRYPWVIVIPRVAGAEEIFDLTRAQQALLTDETNAVAKALSSITDPTKMNIGALGNIVRQLHIHVIARFETDLTWPGPVWGVGEREPYNDNGQAFISLLKSELALQLQQV